MNQQISKTLVPHFILEQFQQGNYFGQFQAATLFVDLSGFTPLTETLMQHDKDGAEALAVALRAIFSPLFAEVYKRGGIIPLFAGDGFTSIFPVQDKEDLPSTCAVHGLTGEAAAAKRARAAIDAIQERLHGEGRIVDTPYGDFTVSATAGLSFGTVQWGIPGKDGLRTFYFRGQAIDNCAAAEQQAEDGHVFVDNKFLAVLPSAFNHSEPSKGAAEFDLPVDQLHGGQASLYDSAITPFVNPNILYGSNIAEFRNVCVLFLSFQELDAEQPEEGVERATAEDIVGEMHGFISECMELAKRFGGTLNQLDFGDMGGYMLFHFGAPISHENDVERAATFLMTLREQAWSLPWRAGIDYGTVWAGVRGGAKRQEYGIAGTVINLASHLFLKAPWNEIWTSDTIYGLLQSTHVFDGLGEITLKKNRKPTSVYRLMRPRQDVTESGLYRIGLVGREEELTQLNGWVEPLFEKRSPGMILIQGEAGIGKSRLVQEWREQLATKQEDAKQQSAKQPVFWLRIAGDATRQRSFGSFREGLRHFIQTHTGQSFTRDHQYNRQLFELGLDTLIETLVDVGAEADELIEELERTSSFLAALVDVYWEDSLYAQVEPQLRFENMLTAVNTYAAALSLIQPVILHLEDLHWFDGNSRQMVQSLVHHLGDSPVALLGTTRPPSQDESELKPIDKALAHEGIAYRVVELGHLSRSGIVHYAHQVLQGNLSDELVDFLHNKTNGNPLFVEQLALDLLEQGSLTVESQNDVHIYGINQSDMVKVPATISGVLVSRLDRLKPAVKEVVQTASVLGREFDSAVLRQMLADQPDLFDDVRQAHRAGIWQPIENGERYLFDHALLRDAAYDMQLRSQLRGLHNQAGRAIEYVFADNLAPHYANLAHHFEQTQANQEAVHWYSLAGDFAIEQYANEEALQHLNRAIQLAAVSDHETRYSLLLSREAAANWLGLREVQRHDIRALSEAATKLDDPLKQSDVALREASYALLTAKYQVAQNAAKESVFHAERTTNHAAIARAYHRWGRSFWESGLYDKAVPNLEKALAISRSASEKTIEAQCLYDLGVVNYFQHQYGDADVHVRSAYQIYKASDDKNGIVRCLSVLAVIQDNIGRYADAAHLYVSVLDLARQIGWRYGLARFLNQSGNNLYRLGQFTECKKQFKEAISLCRDINDDWTLASTLDMLGLAEQVLGNPSIARVYFEEALEMYRLQGHNRSLGFVLTHLGALLVELGEYTSAKELLDEAWSIRFTEQPDGLAMDTLAERAFLALKLNHFSQAFDHVQMIVAWLEEHGETGIDFPIRVYYLCVQVMDGLTALNSGYAMDAKRIYDAGHALLQDQANNIKERELREQFLKGIPLNNAFQSYEIS